MASMLPLTAILNPSGEAKVAVSSVNPVSSRLPSSSAVNFYPFEDLDETSIREILRFQIHTFGRIQDSCRRIPYNTGKRDFYEKTGRTCFEVFQYDFKVPGCDTPWTVMWDYKIGLVRTTPFFKCCDYSKTISAKMLNLNPGLRDISHSITGGAIRAQGYWMPFECARAVCATFCYRISGALIPLFGPTFPSECIPPNTQHYGRMIINPAIVLQSTRQAAEFRRLYGSMPSPPTPSLSSAGPHSPVGHQQIARSLGYRHSDHRQGWRSGTIDSDVDGVSNGHSHFTRLPPLHTHMPTPALSSAESSYSTSTPQSSPRIWTAVNSRPYPQHVPVPGQREWRYGYPTSRYDHLEVDPYRSAVSSSPVSQKHFYHQPLPRPHAKEALRPQPKTQPDASPTPWVPGRPHNALSPGDKRAFDDYEYDAGESANGSSPEAPSPRVFQKTRPQIPLREQPKQSETRRCSWSAQVPHSASTNHGSETSKSDGSLAEVSESDPMSQSSHENEDPRRPLQDRGVPSRFGGCQSKSSSVQDSKTTDIRKQHEFASSQALTPRSVNDRSVENAHPTACENKRTPSFSGAERVAALTLLHLGVLGQQDIDHARKQHHTPARQDDHDHLQPSDTEMDAYSYGNLVTSRTIASAIHSGMESDMDMSESTAHDLSDKRAPASSETALRRGSRDRKRRKGRSI